MLEYLFIGVLTTAPWIAQAAGLNITDGEAVIATYLAYVIQHQMSIHYKLCEIRWNVPNA